MISLPAGIGMPISGTRRISSFKRKALYTYEYGYAPVYRLLSEMDAKDYRLIHPGFCLVYLKQPMLSRTHNLTLTVTDGKWKQWVITWQQRFE